MKNLSFLVLLFTTFSKAQTPLVSVKSEPNTSDRSIVFFAESNSFATQTVRLKFTTLIGYSSTLPDASFTSVNHGRSQLAKLTPSQSGSNSYSYSYSYFLGKAMRKLPDTSFIYLLPGTIGKKLLVNHVSSVKESIGQKEESPFHSVSFLFNYQDTICATRAGTVYNVLDTITTGESFNQRFSHQRNTIGIEHKDGTLAHYSILAPIKSLVSPGDVVIPGQPLAVFNKESDKHILIFSVNYLDEKKLVVSFYNNITNANNYTSLPANWLLDTDKTSFINTPEVVTCLFSPKVIGAELSKREKKKAGIE